MPIYALKFAKEHFKANNNHTHLFVAMSNSSSTNSSPILSDPAALWGFALRCLQLGIGLLFNASLVLVTIKDKTLRSPCNILIAFEAGFCALYQVNVFSTMTIALSGVGLVHVRTCCLFIQSVPVAGVYSYMSTMLLVALDRLMGILFPIWYYRVNKSTALYIVVMLCMALVASAFNLQYKFRWVLADAQKDQLVPCQLTDCKDGVGVDMQVSFIEILVLNGLMVIAYFVLWIVLRHKQNDTTISVEAKKNIRETTNVFKALAILIICYSGCQMTTSFFRIFLPYILMPPLYMTLLVIALSIISTFTQLVNMPVLAMYSSTYNRAFKKWLSRQSATTTANLNVVNNIRMVNVAQSTHISSRAHT